MKAASGQPDAVRRRVVDSRLCRGLSGVCVGTGGSPVPGRDRRAARRHGITLMEVLISMFVLLFGLMGVAAIFPVGNHYVVEGEKFDQGSILAQNAFEELQSRGMLRPEGWLYSSSAELGVDEVIVPAQLLNGGTFNLPMPPIGDPEPGPGHAFVVDPLGVANADEVHFPFSADGLTPNNPWSAQLAGNIWPVRRLTLPIPDPTNTDPYIRMTTPVAETIFRLRDDLAVELPDRDDVPGIQRWTTRDVNNTPNNPNDDVLLTRQYQGNFSWLATIVPTTQQALLALQPAMRQMDAQRYEVSVVVFYKRDTVPSALSERLLEAEMQGDGELVLYATGTNADQFVDKALEEIKPGDWISVMGVNQNTGQFTLKWYRLLSLDEENTDIVLGGTNPPAARGRHAMLYGPDWPQTSLVGGGVSPYEGNLRAAIVPGVASVVTREMALERDSIWNGN